MAKSKSKNQKRRIWRTLLLAALCSALASVFLEKMLKHDPEDRPPLDEVARHAWLGGGLDTAELNSSFSGLQHAQELTQRQLGTLNAWLRSNSLADA